MNNILLNNEIKKKLMMEIGKTSNDVLIISAFCKRNIIEEISSMISPSVKKKRLLVRFQYADIMVGATDLHLYETCTKYGWELYIKLDLHAKTYVFDKTRCIVGSANATNKGLGFSVDKGNDELATFQQLSDEDYRKIESLLNESVLVTDEIYSLVCNDIEIVDKSSTAKGWSVDILKLFDSKIEALFTNDFPMDRQPIEGKYYDILDGVYQLEEKSKAKFVEMRCYRWLKQILEEKEDNEIYFGELSAKLHQVLVSDPPAFRREVKELVVNLLGWIEALSIEGVEIDTPRYSQRITLCK